MKGIYKITLFSLTALLLVACSRKKDSFVSRNYHAVTGEFNSLYNGQVAYDAGMEQLALTFNDDFWEILPIERMETTDEIVLPGAEGKDPNFNKAEEKAAKSIQKHSMYFDGEEHNPITDEAYLLLGKARYFDQRFIPALDAFNFILDRYPTSDNINKANVWRAKTQIRLNNEEIAVISLKKMLEKQEIDEDDVADASAMIAQAYIKMDSLPQALPYIKDASMLIKNNELKGRYLYIKGQLYNTLGYRDSANLAFNEVIDLNRKTPRRYLMNAYLAKARNFDYDKEDKVAFLELINRMEESRENRDFLDKIYFQKAEFYRNTQNIDTAVTFYNKSLRATKGDKTLLSKDYQTLAEINFDRALYKSAGAYYDSTLLQMDERSRPFRRIKKKRVNLDDVIKYEDIAINNDSVLQLVAMSDDERLAYFTNYTNELKEQATKDSLAVANAEERGARNTGIFPKNGTTATNSSGTFYFYNSSTAAYGKQEFRKIWGKRELTDNWRISSKQKDAFIDNETAETETETEGPNELFDPNTYISAIPSDQKLIDSLAKDRNFAYYQLGLIYKEKFKEYDLASNRLEKLLTLSPEERLILPAKYNLYKIYNVQENSRLADQYKNDILTNHGDSRYAEILRNPNTALANDESSPAFKYNALYKKFEAAHYQEVIDTADDYITDYTGTDIVPKLELLKATAIGKQQGFEAYKKALNFVALTYPNDEEGKQAQVIYSTTLPKLAFNGFTKAEESKNFKLVYPFTAQEGQAATDLQKLLDEIIVKANYTNMSTSIDYYTPNRQFVIVHGLRSGLGSRGFGEMLNDGEKENRKYKITRPFFEISSDNYKIVQIHKNLDAYLTPEEIESKDN